MNALRYPSAALLALVPLAAALGCAPGASTGSGDAVPHDGGARMSAPTLDPLVERPARAGLPGALFDPAARLPEPELEHRGATALGLALRRVGPTQRVLMIGAHPDDENTAILSELALGRGADVAYLSLTRGEGGQNIIGGEFEEALGLLRTEELLAARRLDGAVQFFSRAYDFGFSRSAEETFRHWPRDSVLSDVVAVIRTWRPDIVISQFTGTPRDGHGHHQAAGILAREAYVAASDPARFPEQLTEGASPHGPARFYQSWFRPIESDSVVVLQTGSLDPLLGRSRFQVAMASRSRHRSQEMGRGEPAGPQSSMLSAVAPGPVLGAHDLFDALPATLLDRAHALVGDGAAAAPILERLRAYDALARDAREAYRPALGTGTAAARLVDAAALLDSAYVLAGMLPAAYAARLRFHIAAERMDVARAATAAAGIVLDVVADRAVVSPGDTVTMTLSLWNGGETEVRVARLEPVLPDEWWAHSDDVPIRSIPPGEIAQRRFRVHLPADADVDVPYFLERPRTAGGNLYLWPDDPDLRARPFQPASLRGVALVMGTLPIEAAATHIEVDPARGELREPVLVLPAYALGLEPEVAVLPLDDRGRPRAALTLEQTERAHRLGSTHPEAWQVPDGWDVRVEGGAIGVDLGDAIRRQARVSPPDRVAPGDYRISLSARDGVGVVPTGYSIVDYPHTSPRIVPESRATRVRAFPVNVPDVRVAYVPGPGDATPNAIAALGIDVDTIHAPAIAAVDLSRYDVVVIGVRAYDVQPALGTLAARQALERFVRDGGALIVQYSQYEFAEEGRALLPLTMTRPHDRVTDEHAPVRLLDPSHPVLSAPNRITLSDFEDWVKERGLYFASTWDDAYTPLLEMADPGREPVRGGLLAARVGDGWYVYTGLSLFRQLPAGVPGAYRLLANLLALGAN